MPVDVPALMLIWLLVMGTNSQLARIALCPLMLSSIDGPSCGDREHSIPSLRRISIGPHGLYGYSGLELALCTSPIWSASPSTIHMASVQGAPFRDRKWVRGRLQRSPLALGSPFSPRTSFAEMLNQEGTMDVDWVGPCRRKHCPLSVVMNFWASKGSRLLSD